MPPRPEHEKYETLSVDEPMSNAKPAIVEKPIITEVDKPKNEQQPTAITTTAKKKGKKKSYKAMMAGMVVSSPGRDVEKEKEALRKVTGGGAFSKLEKI